MRIEIEMNNSAGLFQVDELLATKLRGSGIEEHVEVVARDRRRAREAAGAGVQDLMHPFPVRPGPAGEPEANGGAIRGDALVELDQVTKSFGDNVVLDGVDLDVERGSAIVIAGPSGSGKSTMLRCINGLEPIDSGEVRFDGAAGGLLGQGAQPAAGGDRDGLPAVQPVPAHDRARQRRARPGQGEGRGRERGHRARAPAARAGGHPGEGGRVSRPTCPAASSSGWRSPVRWRWSRS